MDHSGRARQAPGLLGHTGTCTRQLCSRSPGVGNASVTTTFTLVLGRALLGRRGKLPRSAPRRQGAPCRGIVLHRRFLGTGTGPVPVLVARWKQRAGRGPTEGHLVLEEGPCWGRGERAGHMPGPPPSARWQLVPTGRGSGGKLAAGQGARSATLLFVRPTRPLRQASGLAEWHLLLAVRP